MLITCLVKKVITTVGPQVLNEVTKQNELELSSCYKNSLEYAIKNNYNSIAFPSISTGLFGYPINKAKIVAYNSVKQILSKYKTNIKVIFNVFSKSDYNEYKKLFKNYKFNKKCRCNHYWCRSRIIIVSRNRLFKRKL